MKRVALSLVLYGCGAAARPPPRIDNTTGRGHPCPSAPLVTIRDSGFVDDEHGALVIEGDPEGSGEPGTLDADEIWRADLDGDGRLDRALRVYGACGNHGDCLFGVFAACGGGRYATLSYGYAYELEVGPGTTNTRSGQRWRDLRITSRVERRQLDGTWEDELVIERSRFDGRRYVP